MDIYGLPPTPPGELLAGLIIAIVVVWLGVRSARKHDRHRTTP